MFSHYIKRFIVALLIVHAGFACGVDIFQAVRNGDVEKVAHILSENPELVNAWQHFDTPLHCAVRYGHEEILRLLLSRGADVNAGASLGYMTPMYLAIKSLDCANYDTVVLLVQHGADTNDYIDITRLSDQRRRVETALYATILKSKPTVSQFLIWHGAVVRNGEEERKLRNLWPDYNWRADKEAFKQARIDYLMSQFDLPKDLATLILAIEGIVPPRVSGRDANSPTLAALPT